MYMYIYVYLYIYIWSLPDYEPGSSRAHWKHFVCGAAAGVCVQVRVVMSTYLSNIYVCLFVGLPTYLHTYLSL